MSEAVYVVQEYRPGGQAGVWRDLAVVTVPARTHRKTVIEKALEQANASIDGVMTVRVLDEQSARESKVETEQPPPRLRIG
jgi:hypothetical protein